MGNKEHRAALRYKTQSKDNISSALKIVKGKSNKLGSLTGRQWTDNVNWTIQSHSSALKMYNDENPKSSPQQYRSFSLPGMAVQGRQFTQKRIKVWAGMAWMLALCPTTLQFHHFICKLWQWTIFSANWKLFHSDIFPSICLLKHLKCQHLNMWKYYWC